MYKKVDIKKTPKRYRDIIRFIVEHRLIKHVITIQRFVRRRKMRKWVRQHRLVADNKVKYDVSFLENKGFERG